MLFPSVGGFDLADPFYRFLVLLCFHTTDPAAGQLSMSNLQLYARHAQGFYIVHQLIVMVSVSVVRENRPVMVCSLSMITSSVPVSPVTFRLVVVPVSLTTL